MSAIWGCIDLSGKGLEQDISGRMSKCISKYKVDDVRHLQSGNVYMACGIQFITKESHFEVLPYSEDSIFFTADCVLDDREKLILELNREISGEKLSSDTPDGRLLLLAYQTWGEAFGNHVLGLFSFAVYDQNKNEFHLYTDHTSSRCVHYYVEGSKVYFGTLTSCITDAVDNIEFDEKWMTACMATDNPTTLLFVGLTPFENVYILPYGTGIKAEYDKGEISVTKIKYYDPLSNIKMDKKLTEEECRTLFVDTFKKCVEDATRTDANVAISLSSGLDSSAVGSVAATFLQEENKPLYSYTSIPLKEFDHKHENKYGYWIDDETKGVEIICQKYKNIIPHFLDCEGKSALTDLDKLVDYLEFPSKAAINHIWMSEVYKKAVEDKCKIVLDGAYGNMTISYGDIFKSAYMALTEGKVITAGMQLSRYGKNIKVSRKRLLRIFCEDTFGAQKVQLDGFLDEELLRKELSKKYNIRETWEERFKRDGQSMKTIGQYRNNTVSPLLLQLMGIYKTKDGLFNGCIIRDPTEDKRIIELCLKLPYRCLAWDGVERKLVRSYLNEYVPDEIRGVISRRGRQSGDAVMRYEKYDNQDIRKNGEGLNSNLTRYFDTNKAIDVLKAKTSEDNLMRKVKILSCSSFLDKYGEK